MMKSSKQTQSSSKNKKKRKRNSSEKKGTKSNTRKLKEKVSSTDDPNKEQQQQQQQESIQNDFHLSLSSRLKRIRGTASTTPLPPEWTSSSSSSKNKKYLTPNNNNEDDQEFKSCHEQSYKGFCWDDPSDISSTIHTNFDYALKTIDKSGLFLYDVVQPGGKKSTLTFVSRTLVGNPGSTYKYLGLRLFSHPWCAVDESGDAMKSTTTKPSSQPKEYTNLVKLGYSKDCSEALITIGQLNQSLIQRTNEKLNSQIVPYVKDGLVGSAEYTITLINKMEPSNVKKDLKLESIHGLGKTSVSWHKDSGLQDFSSIAVYHTFDERNGKNDNDSSSTPWKVALRVADSNTKTPALSVPLPSGACYYLLDDFNHQHEHAVISGSDTLRYSSTHRVAKDGLGGTWQLIRDKSKRILSSTLCSSLINYNNDDDDNNNINSGDTTILLSYNTASLKKKVVKEIRSYYQLMTELEFEWIRLWNIQGQLHANLHMYWHKPIEQMKEFYLKLKKAILLIFSEVRKVVNDQVVGQATTTTISSSSSSFLSEEFFDVAIEACELRQRLKASWDERVNDKIFSRMPKIMRPITCTTFDDDEEDGDNAMPTSKDVRKLRSDFVLKQNASSSTTKQSRKNVARMTKKESKGVQSNWQRMKSSLKKK